MVLRGTRECLRTTSFWNVKSVRLWCREPRTQHPLPAASLYDKLTSVRAPPNSGHPPEYITDCTVTSKTSKSYCGSAFRGDLCLHHTTELKQNVRPIKPSGTDESVSIPHVSISLTLLLCLGFLCGLKHRKMMDVCYGGTDKLKSPSEALQVRKCGQFGKWTQFAFVSLLLRLYHLQYVWLYLYYCSCLCYKSILSLLHICLSYCIKCQYCWIQIFLVTDVQQWWGKGFSYLS